MKAIGEAECCHFVFVISKKEFFVGEKPEHLFNGKTCSQFMNESVHCPAKECYAPLSKYVINSCEKMGCNDQVDRFRVVLPSVDGIADSSKNP